MISSDELRDAVVANVDAEKFKKLLDNTTKENINKPHASTAPEGDMTILHYAAGRGYNEILQLLVDDPRTDLEAKTSKYKFTALHKAATYYQVEACRILTPISDVLAKSDIKVTPYKQAKQNMRFKGRGPELMEKAATIANILKVPTFIAACSKGDIALVKTMVEDEKIDINTIYKGMTALFYSCSAGEMEVFRYLLSQPALNPNQKNKHGDTVLHCIPGIRFRDEGDFVDCSFLKPSLRFTMVRELIQRGADPNIKGDEDGLTPLFAAASHNSLDVVKALVASGADLKITCTVRGTDIFPTEESFLKSVKRSMEANADVKAEYEKIEKIMGPNYSMYKEYKDNLVTLDIANYAINDRPEIHEYIQGLKSFVGGRFVEFLAARQKLNSLHFQPPRKSASLSSEQESINKPGFASV